MGSTSPSSFPKEIHNPRFKAPNHIWEPIDWVLISWWKSVDPARPSGCTTQIVFTFHTWCQAVAKDGEVWVKQHAKGEIPMTRNQSECHSFMVLRDPRLYYTLFSHFFASLFFDILPTTCEACLLLSFLHVPPLVFNVLAKNSRVYIVHMFSPIDMFSPPNTPAISGGDWVDDEVKWPILSARPGSSRRAWKPLGSSSMPRSVRLRFCTWLTSGRQVVEGKKPQEVDARKYYSKDDLYNVYIVYIQNKRWPI